MKLLLFTLGAIFSFATLTASAKQQTTLHVPFFMEVRSGPSHAPTYEYISVAELNKILIQKGQSAQLTYIELTMETKFDNYENSDKLEQAIAAAGIKDMQTAFESVPASYSDGENFTCFRGNGEEVIDIVLNNTDNLYSDQFSLIAWRYKKKVVLGDWTSDEETPDDFLKSQSSAWKNYDVKSDVVLILAATGDDGTDVNESIIPRCK